MTEEKVSIITITYNAEDVIEECMKSVLGQQYRPLEYIIVDGKSTDNTCSIIESYIPLFENKGIEVKYKSEPDNGISDAFNKGIDRSTGGIIGIINADDRYCDNIIQSVAKAFMDECDILCGDILWYDPQLEMEYIRKSTLDWNKMKYRMMIMHPSCFIRKRAYDEYGTYDSNYSYAMDYELLCRMHRKGAFIHYCDLVISRMSANGASDKENLGMYKEIKAIQNSNGVLPIYSDFYIASYIIRNRIVAFLKKTSLWKKFLKMKGRV